MILLKNIITLVLAPILIMTLLIISSYVDGNSIKKVALEDITNTSVVVMSSEVEEVKSKSKSAVFEKKENTGIPALLIATLELHDTIRDYKR